MPKKIDPENYDYNKDKSINYSDKLLGQKDYNKDGKVTSQEEQRWNKEQSQQETEYTYDAQGNITSTKTTTGTGEGAPAKTISAEEMGFSKAFLKKHPEVAKAIRLAIKNTWTEAEFVRYVETQTRWGKITTDAQAAFDLQYTGEKSEDLKTDIARRAQRLMAQAGSMGVTLSEEEATSFATRFIRNGLDDQDAVDFLSSRFSLTGAGTTPVAGATGPSAAQATQGTSALILDELRRLARSYGITIPDETLQSKVQEGLKQGANWQSWVEGQRGIFREQAKMLYPTVNNRLDNYTLTDLLDPYLNDASQLLGVDRNSLQDSMTDPMWIAALNGENGQPMSREQWIATLRSDAKYGWNKTQRAKTEYAGLGDELLAAFGMA